MNKITSKETVNPVSDSGVSGRISAPIDKPSAAQFLRQLKDADEPLELVEALQAQDLLLVLREADDEQRGDLLALSNQEQFEEMLDLSCWRGDAIDFRRVEDFLAPLVARGLDDAQLALNRLGEELKTLLFQRYVRVHLREDKDDEIPVDDDAEVIACSDRFYFIEFVGEDGCPDVVRGLLQALLSYSFEEYQRELECIRHDLPTELEENAYRWRTARMADLGFGTREEGLALLSPKDPARISSALCQKTHAPLPSVSIPVPLLVRHHFSGATLLDAAVEILQHSEDPQWRTRAAQLPAEFSAMTNLLLSGIDCDLGSVEEISRGTRLARDLVCLGLAAVGGDTPMAAATALVALAPGSFVQAAMGVLVPLRERARAIRRNPRLARRNDRAALLDPPHRTLVDILSMEIPRWWVHLEGPGRMASVLETPGAAELKGFDSLKLVADADRLLLEAEQVEEVLYEHLDFAGGEAAEALEDGTFSSFILTALARTATGEDARAIPISTEVAEQFAEAFADEDEEQVIADAIAVLSEVTGAEREGALLPDDEPEAMRRLLLRALHIGRARILAVPASSLLLTSSDV